MIKTNPLTPYIFVALVLQPEMFPPDSQPLLVLVNSKSGGGQGADMLAAFQRLLNPHQVHSLADGGPLPGYALLLVVLQQKLKNKKRVGHKW